MTDAHIAVGMLLILILAIFLGFPVAFTLMALGVGFGYYAYFDAGRMWRGYDRALESGADTFTLAQTWIGGFFNNRIFDLFVNQTYSVIQNDVLTAIPLFLFMGYIVERANIVDRLFSTLFQSHAPGARLDGGRGPRHLHTLCHGNRHRRGRGDVDGTARPTSDAEGKV